ncbi:MAG TPA: cytochrome P450 [Mycobacteriales bacterium]|nr:cytochrome P450 [Mycobacteriales bacterium]
MTDTVDLSFNPFMPGFTDNPYPHFAELRESRPIEPHPLGFWALWRYRDVAEVLRAKMSVEEGRNSSRGPMAEAYERALAENGFEPSGVVSMLDRDPPDHTRLRKLVSTAFTPRTIAQLEPTVQKLVDEALDAIDDAGSVNLIDTLAFPLPFTVISVMMGMPETDSFELREMSSVAVRSLEPVPDEETVSQIVRAQKGLVEVARNAIAWKRDNPADDLLTALINAEDSGDMLSDDELVAQVILLYVAGHETTVNLIGNGTLALLQDREQLELWRDRPDLDENAVEELLRFDSPVQMTRRVTLEDYAVDGVTVPTGTTIIAGLASANRDPEQFGPDAHRVRVDRDKARQQVSFGAGIHHCLGAALARLEGRVAVASLLRRFPQIDLDGQPVWNGRINLRGLTDLPVRVR